MADSDALILLDGPLGTELERRGLALPAPAWSASAIALVPDLVRNIHADYAAAGADVHTAATFRTTPRGLAGTPWDGRWRELTTLAVELCRGGIEDARSAGREPARRTPARVAGSLAPLEDCFSPELTPDDAALKREHTDLAQALAAAGCDLLLVETMPTLRELVAATQAAAATGLPVWSAITLGPEGDYFDAQAVAAALTAAQASGAEAFLINCTPPDLITAHLRSLASKSHGLRLGAYGNALFEGHLDWPAAPFAEQAAAWVAAGASIVGGCCGTTPGHLAALRERLVSGAGGGA